MWHVTYDMWHLTRDRYGEVNLLSKFQVPSSHRLGMKVCWRYTELWRYFHKVHSLNDGGDCRTAPATPGLLNMKRCVVLKRWEDVSYSKDEKMCHTHADAVKWAILTCWSCKYAATGKPIALPQFSKSPTWLKIFIINKVLLTAHKPRIYEYLVGKKNPLNNLKRYIKLWKKSKIKQEKKRKIYIATANVKL